MNPRPRPWQKGTNAVIDRTAQGNRMHDITRFVIFSFPRTRSSLLCHHLDSHPQIICHCEVFHQDAIYLNTGYHEALGLAGPEDTNGRDRDAFGFVDCLYRTDLSGSARAIGFKMFPDHNPAIRAELAADPSVSKVLLTRNPLYAFASWKIAIAEAQWTTFTMEGHGEKSTEVDADEFLAWHDRNARYFEEIREACKRAQSGWLEVASVDVPSGAAFANVTQWLGLEPTGNPSSKLKPRNTPDLRKRIRNYAALRSRLDDLGHEHLFDESEERSVAPPHTG